MTDASLGAVIKNIAALQLAKNAPSCFCKIDCSTRMCGCKKKHTLCTDRCACAPDRCKNRLRPTNTLAERRAAAKADVAAYREELANVNTTLTAAIQTKEIVNAKLVAALALVAKLDAEIELPGSGASRDGGAGGPAETSGRRRCGRRLAAKLPGQKRTKKNKN